MDRSAVIQKRLEGRLGLATLPRVAQRVKDALKNGDSNLGDIGELIALDPPLTARLLRSVNSALYGLSTEVVEPAHAASILGVKGLRNLILRAPVMKAERLSDLKRVGFDAVELWRESLAQSRLALVLRKGAPVGVEPERLEVCGLLANLGRFALCEALREEYAEACLRAREQRRPLTAVEEEAFGFAHTELGAMLASRWSLPEDVVKAARFHHNEKGLAEVDPLCALLLAAGEATAVLAEGREAEGCVPALIERLPERTAKLLGLDRLEDDRRKTLGQALLAEFEEIKV